MPYTVTTNGMREADDLVELYQGFSPFRPGCEVMLVAMFDGEPELYALDHGTDVAHAVSELTRQYRDGYGRGPDSITIYDNRIAGGR